MKIKDLLNEDGAKFTIEDVDKGLSRLMMSEQDGSIDSFQFKGINGVKKGVLSIHIESYPDEIDFFLEMRVSDNKLFVKGFHSDDTEVSTEITEPPGDFEGGDEYDENDIDDIDDRTPTDQFTVEVVAFLITETEEAADRYREEQDNDEDDDL